MSGSLAKGFLADIVANIDDDTPRLIYADWLVENGEDERAEFIRVQVERSRLPTWDAAQVRLRLREQELLKQHGEEWLAELPAIEGAKWEGFRRGIIAEVSFASFEAMRQSAHACRAVAPVEAVTVRWPRRSETGQPATPIAELRELSLTGRPNDETEVGWLADSPQLSTLRSLSARGLWAEGFGRLLDSPHLAGLKTLSLVSNYWGNEGIVALVGAASLISLETLSLSGRGLPDSFPDNVPAQSASLEMLSTWSGLATVRSLTLSGNVVGQAGLRALLLSPHIGSLKELHLRGARLNGEAMEELSDAPPELLLETLNLGENVLEELGVAHLTSALCLRELKALWLDRCEVPLSGARLLANAGFLDGLRILDVGHNHFGPAGLGALLERAPRHLHTLRMRDNDLFDQGAALLADSSASDDLLEVDFSQNSLGPAAALALAESAHLGALLILRLADNAVSSSAPALAASPLGQRLAVLEMEDLPPAPPPPPVPEQLELPFPDEDDIPF